MHLSRSALCLYAAVVPTTRLAAVRISHCHILIPIGSKYGPAGMMKVLVLLLLRLPLHATTGTTRRIGMGVAGTAGCGCSALERRQQACTRAACLAPLVLSAVLC